MPPPDNDSLWRGQPACPPALSVLRRRSFWLQFYRLDQPSEVVDAEDRLLAFSETYTFRFWFGLGTKRPLRLDVRSCPDDSLLYLHTGAEAGEISRADENVPMPHTFRWCEIEAIASYVEARNDAPADPSVTLLLLAPFLGGTKDEEVAIIGRLSSELDHLGLLTQAEIGTVVEQRFVADWTNQGVEARWVPDALVGWRLEGDVILQDQRWPVAYSYRAGDFDQFPAAEFIELLRVAGVTDV
jgi:hypothetical protein